MSARPRLPKFPRYSCCMVVFSVANTTSHCCIRKLLYQALRNSSGNFAVGEQLGR